MRPQKVNADSILKLIHLTMLSGTLAFFAVVYFLFVGRETGTESEVLRWVWFGVAVAAVFGAGFLRGRIGGQSTEEEVRTTGILIWALAEGAALIGLVSTIVTGEPMPALGATLIGVFLMVHHRPSQLG
ncbi:MAG: hypothetical protein OEU54_15125 [Gemmatimonadota bacterium]|nr:hypothetical protein [Gemmatimonadota bacterium]